MSSDASLKRIVLVDDHVIVRNGLKELIEKLGKYRIVAEFSNGLEVLNGLDHNNADLIVMDVSMPGMDAEETIQQLNSKNINVPILILTLNQDDARVIRLFRLGVRGYLSKSCSASTMTEALSEIFRTGYYYNEYLQASLVNDHAPQKDKQNDLLRQMTLREREFLKYVCDEKEYTYEQIAGLMGVHPRTVDGYRESLFEKFAIRSKTGLVLFVLRQRIYDQL